MPKSKFSDQKQPRLPPLLPPPNSLALPIPDSGALVLSFKTGFELYPKCAQMGILDIFQKIPQAKRPHGGMQDSRFWYPKTPEKRSRTMKICIPSVPRYPYLHPVH